MHVSLEYLEELLGAASAVHAFEKMIATESSILGIKTSRDSIYLQT